jgi:NAD dependent epimerase/dehydratase family enzyme
MLPVYRLGLGGPIAGGRTWVPWITLHDTAAAIIHVLHTPSITGPVNIVSPTPVTQAEFARALGRRLSRPAIVPVPRALLTLAFGEFARETALKSVRALPATLLASGFRFTHPDLDGALAAVL